MFLIESTLLPNGKGGFMLAGNLDDMTKESAELGLTRAKSRSVSAMAHATSSRAWTCT